MDITIKIIISDKNHSNCSPGCPFLEDDTCLLFSKELKDTKLPKNYEWNDCKPAKDRCFNCLLF